MVTLAHGHDGALWIGYFQAGISRFAHGQLHSYGRQQGVPVGVVPHFSQDREGQLWAAVNGGLRRFDGQRWQPMPASAGLPERRVQWVLHDSRGTFWVVADLRIWMRAAGHVQDTGIAVSQMATLAESPQGEVWLADRVRARRRWPMRRACYRTPSVKRGGCRRWSPRACSSPPTVRCGPR